MGNPCLCARGRNLWRPWKSGRRDDRRADCRPARRLWPLAAAGVLLFRAVRPDGDPAAVPTARHLRQRRLSVNSYRVILVLTALAAALIAPLVAGQYWMSLITQVYIYGLLALSVDLLLGHAGLYSLCQASFFAVAAYTTAILQVRYGYPTILSSYRVILVLTALAAALIAPLVAGQYWMSLITQVYIYGLLALSVDLLLGHAGLYSLCQASFFAVAAYTTAILQVRYGYPTIL